MTVIRHNRPQFVTREKQNGERLLQNVRRLFVLIPCSVSMPHLPEHDCVRHFHERPNADYAFC